MALIIDDHEIEALARALAEATGESIEIALERALRERLAKVGARDTATGGSLADRLDAIALHCASLPVLRDRSHDEILGYDEGGIPS